jgi:hypothetical protein
MTWILVDIGCIECGEASHVIGFYESEKAAEAACEEYSNQSDDIEKVGWGRREWGGQHSALIEELKLP